MNAEKERMRRKFEHLYDDDFEAWWTAIHEGRVGLRSIDGSRLPDLHDVAVSTSDAPLEIPPEHVQHQAYEMLRDAMAQVYPEVDFGRFWRAWVPLTQAARWAADDGEASPGVDAFGGVENFREIWLAAIAAATTTSEDC